MPFLFPQDPPPSSVQVPIILDPFHRFETDQGYQLRRSMHSRRRRLFQVEYHGLTSAQLRLFRDFLQFHRLSALEFSWQSPIHLDLASYASTTPIIVTLPHMYVSGDWVGFFNATHPVLHGVYQITRIGADTFSLNGTTAVGAGTCTIHTYLPRATGFFPEGRWESAVKHIGPESTNSTKGRFSEIITIEELF